LKYPPIAVVAADPLVVIVVFFVSGVNLLAEFAEVVVVVAFIASFAEKSVFVLLDFGADLLVNLL
jgi:hypothetical protein